MSTNFLGDFISSGNKSKTKKEVNYNLDQTARLWLITIILIGGFLILFASLIKTQLFLGPYYRSLADGNRLNKIPIHADRGIIYDKNGIALTANIPSFRLKVCDDKKENCQTSILSKTQVIERQVKGLSKNAILEINSTRLYPFKNVTAHLLGYVSGEFSGIGGIEEEFESVLAGVAGEELVEVDALGNRLRTLGTKPPIAGKDITLNIDVNLQKIAYDALGNKKGSVIISRPDSGQILTLVSSPSYNPNVFTDFSLDSLYRQTQINQLFSDLNQPLFNRSISGTYPPGSTFKIVTATAGLESGKISQNTIIDDPGILIIGPASPRGEPYKFPNWKYLKDGGTQGVLNVVSALKVSNDIFFYEVGGKVGIDGLLTWAEKFNLGKKLGIDLPEETQGTIKTDREWFLGDTYHMAIGQGDLLVTPLQVNTWTAVIANEGKLCQPQVAKSKEKCQEIGISKETLSLIKEGMVQACGPGGTAYPLFGMNLACKTGTAEFGDSKNRTHAWLTAYTKDMVITVLVEAGGEGSDVAAPIVKKILEEWYNLNL